MPEPEDLDYPPKIWASASRIVAEVQEQGDAALERFGREFDRRDLSARTFEVPRAAFQQAFESLPNDLKKVLVLSAGRIRSFNQRIRPSNKVWSDRFASFSWRFEPIPSVGVYVPGGSASYPSSVLMCAIPAKMAGCRVVVCTPPEPSSAVLAACALAKVDSVYQVGGSQAIAALAYGTKTIPRVDKIVGPGGAFVDAAKRLCSKDVAIDFPAGPTELVCVAGSDADPLQVAKDLLAQAEHDVRARVVLLALDADTAQSVRSALKKRLPDAARREVLEESLSRLQIRVTDGFAAVSFLNARALEHVALYGNACSLKEQIQNAGVVYLDTPPALGDYVLGSNHVLPTAGFAKSAGMLSVYDFLKPIVTVRRKRLGLESAAQTFAKAEGLFAHADSLEDRT